MNTMNTTNLDTVHGPGPMRSLLGVAVAAVLLAGSATIAWARQDDASTPGAADAETTTGTAPGSEASAAAGSDDDGFAAAAGDMESRLEASLDELDALRRAIGDETLPMTRRLAELEAVLAAAKGEFQSRVRDLDGRSLDLANLQKEIDARAAEATYLSGLLGEYQRNFESRLHITELQRYAEPLETARLAAENTALSDEEISAAQAALLLVSLERLHDVAGGTTFEGSAVGEGGLVEPGTFVLAGPAAIFHPDEGGRTATAEQRLGSLEPTAMAYSDPEDVAAAAELAVAGRGELPLDPTLGNAHRIEATEESFIEHAKKGGPVMIPIVTLAAAAFLVAILKWIGLSFVRKPSRRRVRELLAAVRSGDRAKAKEIAGRIAGPGGRMLQAGVENLDEPRDIVEETMYETILATRLRLNRFLPFVAISAAAAPLLGLLGTVTGIINTFKLITVFGSGDVKTLSGGISEALVTTEFGLIVAIPSLLLHAFLSRKARGIVDRMEGVAISFANEVARSRDEKERDPEAERSRIRAEVRDALAELLSPKARAELAATGGAAAAAVASPEASSS